MGAARNNQNAIRHGLKTGTLPKHSQRVTGSVNALRRAVESAILARGDTIDMATAANIQTLVRLERHALLCLQHLRRKGDEMTPDQYLRFSEEIPKASAARDKLLRKLGLDALCNGDRDPFATLYSRPRPPESPAAGNGHQSTPTAQDAADAATRDDTTVTT